MKACLLQNSESPLYTTLKTDGIQFVSLATMNSLLICIKQGGDNKPL